MFKCYAFRKYHAQGLAFYAFAVETYGCLNKFDMDYIPLLTTAASGTGKVKYGAFAASVHRKFSVAQASTRFFDLRCSCTPVRLATYLSSRQGALKGSVAAYCRDRVILLVSAVHSVVVLP